MPESPRYRRGSRLLRHSLHSSRNRFLSSRLESVSCRQLWKVWRQRRMQWRSLRQLFRKNRVQWKRHRPPVTK